MSLLKTLCPAIAVFCCLLFAPQARADTFDREVSDFVSGAGTALYLGAGVALPLLLNSNGRQQALRVSDSLVTSGLLCVGLKEVTNVRRPDSDERDSMPSCHATAAFAVATVESRYHPKQALLWYGGASIIALSRVNLNRHRVHEVLAGAALGYLTARFELSQKRGLLLFPLIGSNGDGDSVVGLQVVGSF